MRAGVCKHYRGPVVNQECKAGVNYRDLVGHADRGWGCELPCRTENRTDVECEKRELPTQDEVQAFARWREQRQYNLIEAHRRCMENARAGGFKLGERGTSGFVQCPVCGEQLKYTIAKNGHVHAQCMTEGCIAWMQ